jgi:hypothetical protein
MACGVKTSGEAVLDAITHHSRATSIAPDPQACRTIVLLSHGLWVSISPLVLACTAAHPRSRLFPAWPRPICSDTHCSCARTIARGSRNETGTTRGNPGRGTRATEAPASGSLREQTSSVPRALLCALPLPRPCAHTNTRLHRPRPCSYVLTLPRALSLVRVSCRSPWGVCLRGSIPSAHPGLPRHPNIRGAPSRVRSNLLVLDPVALSLT